MKLQFLPLAPAEAGAGAAELAAVPGAAVDGGQNAPDADELGVRTHENELARAAPPAARRALLLRYRYVKLRHCRFSFRHPAGRAAKRGVPCYGSSEATGMPERDTHAGNAVNTASATFTPSCPKRLPVFPKNGVAFKFSTFPRPNASGFRRAPPKDAPHIPARHPAVELVYATEGRKLRGP